MNGFGLQTPARPNNSCSPLQRARQAFTLVELLVVITIIGILLALLVPTIGSVLNTANDAQMGIEISQIAKSLEAYRVDQGAYPPDFVSGPKDDQAQMNTHLARKFRYRNVQADVIATPGLDPAEALVFWLSGFGGNDRAPLTSRESVSPEWQNFRGAKPYYPFDQTRLQDKDGDGWPEYYPDGSEMPFIYVRADSYGVKNGETYQPNELKALNGNVVFKAYASQMTGAQIKRFAEHEKYQVICAGQDGQFGAGLGQPTSAVYPDGLLYAEADEDNITNFSEGKTLEDMIP